MAAGHRKAPKEWCVLPGQLSHLCHGRHHHLYGAESSLSGRFGISQSSLGVLIRRQDSTFGHWWQNLQVSKGFDARAAMLDI